MYGNNTNSTISAMIHGGRGTDAVGPPAQQHDRTYQNPAISHHSYVHAATTTSATGVLVKLRVLLDAYELLVSVYVQKREITSEDAQACVVAAFNRNKQKPSSDVNVYVSLLVESMVPKIAEDATIKLQIKPTHNLHDKAARSYHRCYY